MINKGIQTLHVPEHAWKLTCECRHVKVAFEIEISQRIEVEIWNVKFTLFLCTHAQSKVQVHAALCEKLQKLRILLQREEQRR